LRLKSKAPHLEPHLTKSCGFATGLEFRESAFQLNSKSEQVRVRVRARVRVRVRVSLPAQPQERAG
jgi:nucleosome binding factor SPN SPT16 subunit